MSENNKDELRSEYNFNDLGESIRGKYYNDFKSGTNLILLEPDIASKFDSEKAVNDALRSLIKLAEKTVKKTSRSSLKQKE